MDIRANLVLFLKGMLIGIANAIPGVSGGTLAFILGIYEDLTFAISKLPNSILKPKEFIKHLKIIIPVGLGAVLAIVLFLNLITYLFLNFSVPTKIFFVGLILGSLPLVASSIVKFNIKSFIAFFFGAFVMGVFAYFDFNALESTGVTYQGDFTAFYGIKLFICGVLAAAAMVIPGISGSLLLLILGEYENIAYFVKMFDILPIVSLGLGVVIGILVISKIITYLISRYRDMLFSFVLGIIIVSLLSLWPNVRAEGGVITLVLSILTLCIGFCLSIFMERLERKKN